MLMRNDFETWAASIGLNTEKVVRFFLESGRAPEQGFKSCVSLKKYAERYKPERIEEACRQILIFSGEPSIRGLGTLMKSLVTGNKTVNQPSSSHPVHRNRGITRGADQFQKGSDEQ